MAHFAELDENNNVVRVIVISNDDIMDASGDEQETIGVELCRHLTGSEMRWVQASYNRNFRKLFPDRPGFIYYENADVFVEPSPFPSWILNGQYDWEAPTPMPIDEGVYEWDETTLTWNEIPTPTSDDIPTPTEEPTA